MLIQQEMSALIGECQAAGTATMPPTEMSVALQIEDGARMVLP